MKLLSVVLLAHAALFSGIAEAETVLEPFTYHEGFETRELGAWAAYPHWEDTSFNEYFRTNTIVPGDPNISIEQVVTPYSNVDTYAGAQKLLDMYLVPGSTVRFRFYLKTNTSFEFVKIRLAAGADGTIDYIVKNPPSNRWEWVEAGFDDFIIENPRMSGKDRIKVNAVAVLAKLPDADPDMPFYFGLDDITIKGMRSLPFRFVEPVVGKLSEWKQYIPERCYHRGDLFILKGLWPLDAERVSLTVTSFTDPAKTLFSTDMSADNRLWALKKPPVLDYPEGLYLGILRAFRGEEALSETEFTIHIAPQGMDGKHPRLWFDTKRREEIKARLNSEKFRTVADDIRNSARGLREKNPIESIVFDIDQFPEEKWLASLDGWFDRIGIWRNGVYYNTLAYTFFDDRAAGEYARDLLTAISKFPYWVHPWFIKRGQFIYYPIGEAGSEFALGYDCLYDIMTENERAVIRDGLWKNIVLGCHRGYVVNNLTTNSTSNWVSNIVSGSLMCQTAMYGDSPAETDELVLTGALLKEYNLIQNGFGSDGGYGEPNGYYAFTMDGLSEALPAIENVFGIDMSAKIDRSYTELIWAGNIKKKYTYYYGKSSGELRPLTRWAWLLPKYKDPLLGWFYNYMKSGETFMDALYETENVPREEPYEQNPVRVFRDIGTTVFKSGWNEDDFIFVMRTGPFYNHQFMDQGSFWLSDRGSLFIERRHGSTEPYMGAVLYEPSYIQPVSHSTILIDHNSQSQRTGDTLHFAEGFDDRASVTHFLDGGCAAFSSGDIGKLYWGKVESMQRNVLYIKPRTLLMLDTITPVDNDVDVTFLYQTLRLQNIAAGADESTISKNGASLHIMHLWPEKREVKAVETPHYLYTLLREKPLVKEGMLTVTVRTDGRPLVAANLLATTPEGEACDAAFKKGDGCVSGIASGTQFAFTTRPGFQYSWAGTLTDALTVAVKGDDIFAALCTKLEKDGRLLLASDAPITCDITQSRIKYYLGCDSTVTCRVEAMPQTVTVNGAETRRYTYNAAEGTITLELPSGEGTLEF